MKFINTCDKCKSHFESKDIIRLGNKLSDYKYYCKDCFTDKICKVKKR